MTETNVTRAWLTQVCREFDLNTELIDAVVPHLLDLTRDIAHGASRPAAPMTAFLVGMAAARTKNADLATTIHEQAGQLQEILKDESASWDV